MPWLIFRRPSKNHVGSLLHESWKGSQVGCLNILMGGMWGEQGPKQVLRLGGLPEWVSEGILFVLHRHCHHQQAGVHGLLPTEPFCWWLPRKVPGPHPGSQLLQPQNYSGEIPLRLRPSDSKCHSNDSGRPFDMVLNQWFFAACTLEFNWAATIDKLESYLEDKLAALDVVSETPVIGLKIEYPWIIHFSLISYSNWINMINIKPQTKIQIDIVRIKDVDYICWLNWKLQCITFW